ncbi:hypothetical protein BDZ89DRAFT_1065574, partial [Hymenopellis radicata]
MSVYSNTTFVLPQTFASASLSSPISHPRSTSLVGRIFRTHPPTPYVLVGWTSVDPSACTRVLRLLPSPSGQHCSLDFRHVTVRFSFPPSADCTVPDPVNASGTSPPNPQDTYRILCSLLLPLSF